MDWDFEWVAWCKFPVFDYATNKEVLCGEPAIARIMWNDGNEWTVCREHLEYMLKQEKETSNAKRRYG